MRSLPQSNHYGKVSPSPRLGISVTAENMYCSALVAAAAVAVVRLLASVNCSAAAVVGPVGVAVVLAVEQVERRPVVALVALASAGIAVLAAGLAVPLAVVVRLRSLALLARAFRSIRFLAVVQELLNRRVGNSLLPLSGRNLHSAPVRHFLVETCKTQQSYGHT